MKNKMRYSLSLIAVSLFSMVIFQNCGSSSSSSPNNTIYSQDFEAIQERTHSGAEPIHYSFDGLIFAGYGQYIVSSEKGAKGSRGVEMYKYSIDGKIENVVIDPNKTYRFSADVRVSFRDMTLTEPSKTPYLNLNVVDFQTHKILYTKMINFDNDEWHTYRIIFTPDEIKTTNGTANFSISLSSAWDSESIIQVDNLKMEEY